MFNKKACILCSREFPSDEAVCPVDGTILTPLKKDLYLGTILDGKYEIQEVIGGGGMGAVYKARHLTIDRIVAIKMLHQHLTKSQEALKRFQLEAQALSCLSSPNILTIFEFGVSLEGQPFMIMDYLEGISLSDILTAEGHIEPMRAVNMFIQICAGLGHAHQKGVLHRDLKPSNIMLVSFGEDQTDFVKIVDFGIAKLLNREEGVEANLTRAGEVYGSPLYMSPEQCRGQELDARSDLYSLGCVMYKVLAGVPAFNGGEIIELLFKQVSEAPPPFAQTTTTPIPAALEAIVMKSLAKLPDDRYASMNELRDALEQYKTISIEEAEAALTPQAVATGLVAHGASSLSEKFLSNRSSNVSGILNHKGSTMSSAGSQSSIVGSSSHLSNIAANAISNLSGATSPNGVASGSGSSNVTASKGNPTNSGSVINRSDTKRGALNNPANNLPSNAGASNTYTDRGLNQTSAKASELTTTGTSPDQSHGAFKASGTASNAADLLAKLTPQTNSTAPNGLSPLQRVATDSARPYQPGNTADVEAKSGESRKPNSTTGQTGKKEAPDWVLLVKGTLANRLIAASLAGVLIAVAAVCYLGFSAEQTQHHPAVNSTKQNESHSAANDHAKESPAKTTTNSPTKAADGAPQSAAPANANVGTKESASAPANSEVDSAEGETAGGKGKGTAHHRQHHAQHAHPAHRHAYSSYGF